MNNAAQTSYPDRSSWLLAAGIALILLGVLCLLLIPMMFVGLYLASAHESQPRLPVTQVVLSAVEYLGLGVFFIAVGYGTLRARKWARALMLCMSWLWLVAGIFGIVFYLMLLPHLDQAILASQQGRPVSPELLRFVKLIGVAIMSVIYLIMPGALVSFYMAPSVRSTFLARDPVVRWTDRCPLPVLGAALIMGLGTVFSCLVAVIYNGVYPFFGVLLSGPAGMAAMMVHGAICGASAWLLYRLKPLGWWLATFGYLLGCVSTALTFMRIDMLQYLRAMQMPEQSVKMLESMGIYQGKQILVWILLFCAPVIGYFFWIRKYFFKKPNHDSQV